MVTEDMHGATTRTFMLGPLSAASFAEAGGGQGVDENNEKPDLFFICLR